MATENKVLMQQAKESLKGKWWPVIKGQAALFLVLLAFGIVLSIVLSILGVPMTKNASNGIESVLKLLIYGPMAFGTALFYIQLSRTGTTDIKTFFAGFKDMQVYGKTVVTYFIMSLYLFLWTLLFIIPGIIKAFAYSQTFYILADNPSLSFNEAIEASMKMMYGYKWKYVGLAFRFFGWSLLCIFTLGIGFIWVLPWAMATQAKFYEDIKNNPITEEVKKTVEVSAAEPVAA
jgi:uncharacterized membrane protein